MRIGIDGRLWSQSGVGRYIRNLVENLQEIDFENEYFLFLLDEDFEKVKVNKNFQKVRANFKWYGVSEQIKFPPLLKKYNLELVHFPHFNVPIFYSGKFIVTIHDLIHQKFEMRRATTHDPIIYKLKQLGYKKIFKTAIQKSEKIIVPSNFVKNELIKIWKVDAKKIEVTYEAVDDKILTAVQKVSKLNVDEVLKKFSIKPPYIFYVGNAHPHKNVEGLIKAFFELRQKYQYLQLVLSGNDHYFWQRIKKEFKHEDVIYTGFITDEELVALYKGAQCFVLPSLEEGFGIPLLEAMACGCVVVSSEKASLKEIGGDACIYFDPNNSLEMQEKIMEVLNSKKLKKQLIEKGEERYKKFSWKKLAKETSECYKMNL